MALGKKQTRDLISVYCTAVVHWTHEGEKYFNRSEGQGGVIDGLAQAIWVVLGVEVPNSSEIGVGVAEYRKVANHVRPLAQ
jgi:hypothetical protein